MRTLVIAELGINHQGDLGLCIDMIAAAADAGCDFVKLQKRNVDEVYTAEELAQPRVGPWGATNGDLKRLLELDPAQYDYIDEACEKAGIGWLASPWDVSSVQFLSYYRPKYIKVASACLTDDTLLAAIRDLHDVEGTQVILSTGMSTMGEIEHAVMRLGSSLYAMLHCCSAYPSPLDALNLRCIETLREIYWPAIQIGYSSHSVSPWPALTAVALGATIVECHLTLDRTMWGTDQAASLEPDALAKLVREIRDFEIAAGDGVKRVMECELPVMRKLRRSSGKSLS